MKSEIRPQLATGIGEGYEANANTIQKGTVRMEHHPDYYETINQLMDDGFTIVENKSGYFAHVVFDLVSGSNIEINKELHVVSGMRWLDLEHELSHIEQIMSRFIAQGFLVFTNQVRGENQNKKIEKRSFILKDWQEIVFEFHARLLEFLSLYERKVDKLILEEHLEGVIKYSELFWTKSTKKWRSISRYKWIMQFFPDIFELRDEVNSIHLKEYLRIIGRVK